jgi:hypothetical protein
MDLFVRVSEKGSGRTRDFNCGDRDLEPAQQLAADLRTTFQWGGTLVLGPRDDVICYVIVIQCLSSWEFLTERVEAHLRQRNLIT